MSQEQLDTHAIEIANRALFIIENHEKLCDVRHEGIQSGLKRIDRQVMIVLGLIAAQLLGVSDKLQSMIIP